MNDKPTIDPKTLPPLTRFIYTLGQLPTSYLMSMTYEEQLVWLCNYLGTQVIPAVNQNGQAVEELQNLYELLRQYVNDYFDNLDVQEEINKKLDEMADDGTLTNLIKNYIDPIYQAYETEINEDIINFKAQTNNNISQLRTEVESIASGSPIPVSSTDDMIDTSKVYLLLTDGYIYYYNGTTWTQGWVYQATVEDYDTTLDINEAIPNSKTVGTKINSIVETYNQFDKDNYINNKYYNDSGVLTNSNNRFISNIIKVKQGDNLFTNIYKPDISYVLQIITIAKVTASGTILSMTTTSYQGRWTADEDCYVRLSIDKGSNIIEDSDINNYFCISKNYANNSYKPYQYFIPSVDNEYIEYDNEFDSNDFKLKGTYNSNINLFYDTNYFTTNIMKCKIGDVFNLNYFNNDSSIRFNHVILLDTNKHNISRVISQTKTYTCSHNGYVIFTCYNPNNKTDIGDYLVISKNKVFNYYVPHTPKIIEKYNDLVTIKKLTNSSFTINFGKYNILLFKTVDVSTNANNWNIGTITDLKGNIIVPTGTDIIGPIRLRDESDFIGGVHGDEKTDSIYIAIDGTSTSISNITELSGKSLNIIMKSSIYSNSTGNQVANKFVTIRIEKNKIHIINSHKFITNVNLQIACTGGLIACRNNIINNIMFNDSYLDEAPTTETNISSHMNTSATINTIYGSITVNNIIGHELDSYVGWLQTFTNENPIRNKVYLTPYIYGSYSFVPGNTIVGEFEYLFS